jgi:hypothetical protein
MNREDIIKLAREVGYPLVEYEGTPYIPPLLAVLLETVAAPQRTWVGLTDEEITELHHKIKVQLMGTYKTEDIYRAIEAKLKEKNT